MSDECISTGRRLQPHAVADVFVTGSHDLHGLAGHRRRKILNGELKAFLFDPPSDPNLLKGKRIAICCTNGVEEVEIIGAQRWLAEHGATVHVVSPRIGEFHPTLGLRFPPQCATHVLAIRLMENAGWLKIDRYTDEARRVTTMPCFCRRPPNPTRCACNPHARDFVRAMHEAGKPTTAIMASG